jgi:hypothetical protein
VISAKVFDIPDPDVFEPVWVEVDKSISLMEVFPPKSLSFAPPGLPFRSRDSTWFEEWQEIQASALKTSFESSFGSVLLLVAIVYFHVWCGTLPTSGLVRVVNGQPHSGRTDSTGQTGQKSLVFSCFNHIYQESISRHWNILDTLVSRTDYTKLVSLLNGLPSFFPKDQGGLGWRVSWDHEPRRFLCTGPQKPRG